MNFYQQAVRIAIEGSKNCNAQTKQNQEDEKDVKENIGTIDGSITSLAIQVEKEQNYLLSRNWHLDYALAGILYSRDINLYNNYKDSFNSEQKCILESYLINHEILAASKELKAEHSRVCNLMFYIFDEFSLKKLCAII